MTRPGRPLLLSAEGPCPSLLKALCRQIFVWCPVSPCFLLPPQSLLNQFSLAYMAADFFFFLIPFTPSDMLFIVHHFISAFYLVVRAGRRARQLTLGYTHKGALCEGLSWGTVPVVGPCGGDLAGARKLLWALGDCWHGMLGDS